MSAAQNGTAPLCLEEEKSLDGLLSRTFRPRTDEATLAVQRAVRTLAEFAGDGSPRVGTDTIQTVQLMIAEIDALLSQQLNQVLHHPRFQQLERTWRGLHYLVSHTEADETMKVRVMNISRAELGQSLRRYRGAAWDQSPLFKKIYEHEFGQFGGEPFGCLVADFEFDHSANDVTTLTEMAKIAAAAHCPMIAAASPSVMQMNGWDELGNPRDIGKIFATPEYAAWRRLRQSSDSRYLALTMPRFLGRLPYGEATMPVEDFAFEERVDGTGTDDFCWLNASYAMAVNINRAFRDHGWCTRIRGIESGGAVEDLPTYIFPSDQGGVAMTCPTETAISDRREHELSDAGFMPLVYRKNSDFAAFIGARTLHEPAIYDNPDATANAELSSRLPYVFASCRFAHYLKCIVRDKVGSFKSRQETQTWLNDWLMNYVDGDPTISSESTKARRPLSAAEVKVEEIEGKPGYYRAQFFLRPHYQLEGMTVSLRLVSKLPSPVDGGR
ncbi:type VI secretion system contractile sheath large subunit [Dyella sp.]|uniref:type VI secretion system contractile sheath large subunit n=1 Tax=Dyella sp. TaxID=1869338 RepID=UPI0039C88B71